MPRTDDWLPIGAWPLSRQLLLNYMAEELRSENWPIVNSLQERTEADPSIESVLDHLPAPGLFMLDGDDADH